MPRGRGDGKLRGKPWAHLRSHYDKNLSEESASPDGVGYKQGTIAVGVCCCKVQRC